MSDVKEIAITEIEVGSRIRGDLGSLDGLADSIARNGLIQPIVITHDNRLIAGERRLRAHEKLGLTHIRYIYADEIDEDEKAEIEFSENFFRKQMHWTEEALGILNIYRKKKLQGMTHGLSESWQKVIAEMLGMSVGNVNYVLAVARKLEQELSLSHDQRRFHAFENASDAYRRGIVADDMIKNQAIAAERQKARAQDEAQRAVEQAIVQEVARVEAAPDLLAYEREKYKSNPNNIVSFEQYWSEKVRASEEIQNTVHLSDFILNVDCLDLMRERPAAFDAIITDPPYAIDMKHLNQQNSNGGLVDLDRVEDAHQVEENVALLAKFWPAAFAATKDYAFVAMFCDIMQWQYLYDLAIAAGFNVQRWPIIWRKVNQSLMNNSPQYNTTKSYEPILIARKPGAVLPSRLNYSIIDGSNTPPTKETGHPFAKAYEVTQVLLDLISTKGQVIFEPFAGGGSIVLQILKAERYVVACEKDPEWYNQCTTNIKSLYFLPRNPQSVFK